jgi:cell division protein FtsW
MSTMSAKAMNRVAVLFGASVLVLLTFGFVMLASTSSAYAHHGDPFYFAKRQALWLGLGLLAGAATACMNYRYYRKFAGLLFIAAVALLAGVLVLGRPINGATRWYELGPVRFQPSEFAKYVLVVALASWLEKMQRTPKGRLRPRIQHWWWGVFAPLAITGGLAVLILREPDLGTTLLLGMAALLLMWVAGSPPRWLAGIVGASGVGIAAFLVAIFQYGMFHGSYQVQRILHWWREDDLQGSNYQQYMAMLALGSGGWHGYGLGNSRMKMAYLAEAHTDFIFPIVGEELGLMASLAVVLLFCALVVGGMLLAGGASDLFGVLLGSGIIVIIGLQAIINLAVVTNSIPNKGMALPFFSYGGSNLVMTLAALGVVWNIFQQSHRSAAEPPAPIKSATGNQGLGFRRRAPRDS